VFIRINSEKSLNFNFKFKLIIKGIIFEIFALNIATQNGHFERKKNIFITKVRIMRIAAGLPNIL